MAKLLFQIFIAGKSGRNEQLVRHYREACNAGLPPESFEITVIDLARQPQLAEECRILATPTIVRSRPAPEKRIIGNLTPEGATRALSLLTEDLNHHE